MSGINAREVGDITKVIVVAIRGQSRKRTRLDRRITLARGNDVVAGKAPSTQQVSHEAMLLFEEGQLLIEEHGPLVRIVQTGEGVFTAAVDLLGRVLGEEYAVAAAKRAEDFANVIQGLAEGVSAANRQLFEQVVGAELHLRCLIVGVTRVGARTNHTLGAIQTAPRISAAERSACIGEQRTGARR